MSYGHAELTGDAASRAQSSPFSERLRLETRASRDEAESAVYFRLLLSGALEAHEYATLMFQYYGVYLELSRAGEALRDDPCAGPGRTGRQTPPARRARRRESAAGTTPPESPSTR